VELPPIPAELPQPIREWAEQFHALVAATTLPSHAQLAPELHVGKTTLYRYVTIERLPGPSTVTQLLDLVRTTGGTVDEAAVLRAHAAAAAVWPDWLRQRGNGHRSPHMADSTDPAADTGDSRAEQPPAAPAQAGEPAEVEPRAARSRRKPILITAVATLIIVPSGVGVAARLGAFHADDPQVPTPTPTTKCQFLSCEGKDHNEQGCDDARILRGGRAEGTMVIEVLYSSACQAAWGKAKGAPDGALVKIVNANGSEQHARAKSGASKTAPKPTPMLPARTDTLLQACINTDKLCTDWTEIPPE
jgi:hypothetical protein